MDAEESLVSLRPCRIFSPTYSKAHGAGEEAARFFANSPGVWREQPAEPSDQRPESYLAASDCLGVPIFAFQNNKTDFTFLPVRSRQRRQKSTPRSTARRARGTLPPSTRSAPSSIPCSGLLIAILVVAGLSEVIERTGGRSCFGRGASGSSQFIFFFSRVLVRLKKEKKKSTQKEEKIKISRSMTTRERSSVQSVRSSIWRGIRGKAKSYQGWCVVWKGREQKLTLPTESSTKNPRNKPKQEPPCRIASSTWSCKTRPTGA